MLNDEFMTVSGTAIVEVERIRGSRFIGDIAPVSDHAEAAAAVSAVTKRLPGASHYCWAYRLANGSTRSSDAGEPSGTAGRPILRRIEKADMSNVIVIVTRFYGGTKLGKGGLARAYGRTAAEVIEAAPTTTHAVLTQLHVTHPYEDSAAVRHVLDSCDASIASEAFTETVWIDVHVRSSEVAALQSLLANATSGRAVAIVENQLVD